MEVLAEIPTAYSAKVLRIRKLFLWEGKPFFVNSIKGESVCKDGSGSGGEQYHNLLWIEISIPQLIVTFFGGLEDGQAVQRDLFCVLFLFCRFFLIFPY